jgi:hypothetical protein
MSARFSLLGILGAALLAACGGSESGTGSDGGGSGSGGAGATCSGGAAEGSYKCDYTGSYSYQVCRGGSWTFGGSCTCSVSVGDPRKPPYATNCKYHATGSIECSYAGVSCKICDVNGCR